MYCKILISYLTDITRFFNVYTKRQHLGIAVGFYIDILEADVMAKQTIEGGRGLNETGMNRKRSQMVGLLLSVSFRYISIQRAATDRFSLILLVENRNITKVL